MMDRKRVKAAIVILVCQLVVFSLMAQDQKIYPGADDKTPSKSQYESWINNTNEGATEQQTLINLDFFGWLYREYGMILDIYGISAGSLDGKNFYDSMESDRFRKKFPDGFASVYRKARSMHTLLIKPQPHTTGRERCRAGLSPV